MCPHPAVRTNAERRALVLRQVSAKLQEIWPDAPSAAARSFQDFDGLEAVAARTGDGLAQAVLEEGLGQVLRAPGGAGRAERCRECGTALQWSIKPRTIQSIRGPIRVEREYGYCRACKRGFSPL